MSEPIKMIRARIKNYQQTFKEMEAKNLAESKDCRARGMDSMADWYDGRASAYEVVAASFAIIQNTLDEILSDGLG